MWFEYVLTIGVAIVGSHIRAGVVVPAGPRKET